MARRHSKNQLLLLVVIAALALLGWSLVRTFDTELHDLLRRFQADEMTSVDNIVKVIRLILLGVLAYTAVRFLNFLVFGLFRMRKGFDAPTLVQNVFSIVAFTLLFFLIFTFIFPNANLGALFTTSAIFGVILGLALQDTLGNFFAGISLQADRPFQVGDVITVGCAKTHRRG